VTAQPLRWELVNPEGAARPALLSPARRPTSLEGKTVGLAWNGKPGGVAALEEIAARLAEQVPGVRFVRYWQTLPASVSERELSPAVIQSIAASGPDVVVVSQGD
jgi:UDP-N-acetyl-D-mannosaminuronic acid transferase (WecB/TagA/CpsF family)